MVQEIDFLNQWYLLLYVTIAEKTNYSSVPHDPTYYIHVNILPKVVCEISFFVQLDCHLYTSLRKCKSGVLYFGWAPVSKRSSNLWACFKYVITDQGSCTPIGINLMRFHNEMISITLKQIF